MNYDNSGIGLPRVGIEGNTARKLQYMKRQNFNPEQVAALQSTRGQSQVYNTPSWQAYNQQFANQPQGFANEAQRVASLSQEPVANLQQQTFNRYPLNQVPTTQDDAISLQRAGQLRLAGQDKPTGGFSDVPWNPTNPSSVLTPFELQQAASEGYTPQAWLMKRRLGNLQVTRDASGAGVDWANKTAQQSGYAPEDLYSKSQFQTLAQQRPQDAQHIFEALTGRKLSEYEQIRAATREQRIKQTDERTKYHVGRARQLVEEDRIRPDPEQPGKFQYREWIQDVTGAKKLGDWIPVEGNAFASETAQHLDQTWVKNAEFAALQQRKATYDQQQAAIRSSRMQKMSPFERQQYESSIEKERKTSKVAPSGFGWNTIMGLSESFMPGFDLTKVRKLGVDPTHARETVQNMEGFQELFASDPLKAQRIIAAIRAGQQVNPNAAMPANFAQDVYDQEAELRGY